MADTDDVILCAGVLVLSALSAIAVSVTKKPRKKKAWVRDWVQHRPEFGACSNLLPRLMASDTDGYRNFLRMDNELFTELLQLVEPIIARKDTVLRKAISVKDRLSVTLRFLATGDGYPSLEYLTWIPSKTIAKIIPDTCAAIYQVLKDTYLKEPKTPEEWKRIAEGFEKKWDLPNCLGALDGKHIKIRGPPGSGSEFFNYRKFHSIVLLALLDADYKFIYVDVRTNGRISDGGVFNKSVLKQRIEDNAAGIPEDVALPGQTSKTPYFIVADDAFALQSYMQKPISRKDLSVEEKIHNYRMSRARRVVENAFGILSAVFRVFFIPIPLIPETVDKVVLASCALHNYLKVKRADKYTPIGTCDRENSMHEMVPGEWRDGPEPQTFVPLARQRAGSRSIGALATRNNLMRYFTSEKGKVDWQWKMI